MSNVLFINLKRNGDIFNTAALAQSYLKENPHATLYILTYDEFKGATKPLSVFNSVFTLDRKKITTFHNHNLYSNGFALDELLEELRVIEGINWSQIINYSSDKASTFITNYLGLSTNTKVSGVHFGDSNNIEYTSSWEIIFNEVITRSKMAPVHFETAYHGMIDTKSHQGPFQIKTITKHNDTISKNFDVLRSKNSSEDRSCSIIGIQLGSSLSHKDWNTNTLTSLLKLIQENEEMFPILLIAPTDIERAYAKELNGSFSNKLIVVESDFLALSSVLKGLDLLVTPDTSVKHLADLNECKVLECGNDFSMSLKQGTSGGGNLILNKVTDPILILNSITFLLNPSIDNIVDVKTDDAYVTYYDKLGWNLKPLNGSFSVELLLRQIKRSYIARWCGIDYSWDIKRYFSDYNYVEVQQTLDKEKLSISSASRDLLGTLRSLAKAVDNPSEGGHFVTSLDKLLSHSENQNLSSIPVIEFKALLENLSCSNIREQLRSTEELLYKLKKNLQVALECLNSIESQARTMPLKKKREYKSNELNA